MTAPATPATGLDLDAVRQRVRAATPGPWRTAWPEGMHPWEVYVADHLPAIEMESNAQGGADAAFIAAARTDVPVLLDAVNDLRDALAELVRLHDEPGDGPETEEAYDRARNLLAKVPPKDGAR